MRDSADLAVYSWKVMAFQAVVSFTFPFRTWTPGLVRIHPLISPASGHSGFIDRAVQSGRDVCTILYSWWWRLSATVYVITCIMLYLGLGAAWVDSTDWLKISVYGGTSSRICYNSSLDHVDFGEDSVQVDLLGVLLLWFGFFNSPPFAEIWSWLFPSPFILECRCC